MDPAALRAQLADVDALLRDDPANGAYKELRASLADALEALEDDDDDDDDEEEEEEEEEDNKEQQQEKKQEPTAQPGKEPRREQRNDTPRRQGDDDGDGAAAAKEEEKKKDKNGAFALPQSMKRKRGDLEKIVLGSVCEAFDEATGVWSGAVLEQYADAFQEGKCKVRFLYETEKVRTVDPEGVRPIKGKLTFDKMAVQIGQPCEARFSGDGKSYPATILRMTPHGCVVRFKRYNNEEEVAYQHIRLLSPEEAELPSSDRQAIAAAMSGVAPGSKAGAAPVASARDDAGKDAEGGAGSLRLSQDIASVPEHLRVKETDSEKVKERKRKALRLLKKQTKAAKKDLALEQKKQGWKAFQAKSKLKRAKR